jgi:uncharacterized protein YbaR (Trm112 family)/SAM-dependent methyltransferase
MQRRLLKWLVCPLCHSALNLIVAEERQLDEIGVEVTTGALTCTRCGVYYPIHNAVPRMLTYPTYVAAVHAQQNAEWIRQHLAGFDLPNAVPPLGEARVLRNFSTEWQAYEWDGTHYWETTPENVLQAIRYSLGIPRNKLRHKLGLEVGIGIGGTADALSRTEDCELIGMDLGYAVDQARRYFSQNPRLHIVQSSVFALPFRPGTFDFVYSHGVLHHTYSTEMAFRSVAQLSKPDGGMLYVWLYSQEQEQATLLRRLLMATERLVRPTLSKLPALLQTISLLPTLPIYMLYQNWYRRHRSGKDFAMRYGWKEALHAARDRLTPPFAYRHTYAEVLEWFESEGYQHLECLRDEKPPNGVPDTYALNVGVRGFRKSEAIERSVTLYPD